MGTKEKALALIKLVNKRKSRRIGRTYAMLELLVCEARAGEQVDYCAYSEHHKKIILSELQKIEKDPEVLKKVNVVTFNSPTRLDGRHFKTIVDHYVFEMTIGELITRLNEVEESAEEYRKKFLRVKEALQETVDALNKIKEESEHLHAPDIETIATDAIEKAKIKFFYNHELKGKK